MRLRTPITASLAAVGVAAALASTTLGGTATAHGDLPRQASAPTLDHVFVIMLENHSQSSVIDDANAPFITGLAHKYAMADHYYGVTHPSMPNYVAAIAGSNFGIQDDEDENVVNLDRVNLVDQLEAAGIRWDAYMQDLPADKLDRYGPTYNGTLEKLYAKKHNPFVLFDDIKNDPARMSHVKDYSELATDLDRKHAPQFVWISPNQCNDMHGGIYDTLPDHPETPCPYGSAKDDANDAALKQKGDAFVKQAVKTIRASDAWTGRSAIVIVTDENDYTGNASTGGWETADGCCDSPYIAAGDKRVAADGSWPGGTYGGGLIPAIVVGRHVKKAYVDHSDYNHYSLLATIQENWHLGHLANSGDKLNGVHSMWSLFD